MILLRIQQAADADRYRITVHAAERMISRDILQAEIISATQNAEVIEDYPDDTPLPSCLLLGWVQTVTPLHMVWAFDAASDYAVLVTVYRPDLQLQGWSSDFRRRLK